MHLKLQPYYKKENFNILAQTTSCIHFYHTFRKHSVHCFDLFKIIQSRD